MSAPQDETQGTQVMVDDAGVRIADEYRRRKVTSMLAIVFTDVEGSTQLREGLGESAYEHYREEHVQVVRDLVESRGAGAMVKDTGDGALAVFAEPSTAVVTALEIQSAVASHPVFKLRIGIDVGQVSVASKGGIIADVFGRQVNRAARIQSLAQPQHVLTSFSVYDCAVGWLLGTNVKWHHHGATSLKGFADEFSIHEPYDPQRTAPQAAPWQKSTIENDDITGDVTSLVEQVLACYPASPELALPPALSAPEESRWQWLRQKIEKLGIPPRPWVAPFVLGPIRCPPGADPISFYEWEIQRVVKFRTMVSTRTIILWVDDFPENNLFERRTLTAAGCQFDLATSTEEAEHCLDRSRYDLVITDMGRGENPTAGLELLKSFDQAGGRVHTARNFGRVMRWSTLEGDRARQAIVVSTLAPTGARIKA